MREEAWSLHVLSVSIVATRGALTGRLTSELCAPGAPWGEGNDAARDQYYALIMPIPCFEVRFESSNLAAEN